MLLPPFSIRDITRISAGILYRFFSKFFFFGSGGVGGGGFGKLGRGREGVVTRWNDPIMLLGVFILCTVGSSFDLEQLLLLVQRCCCIY